MPYTYILQCADDTYYTGWTVDLARRLEAHNAGTGARYTRGRRPVRLVYGEVWPNSSSARKRECAIKRLTRRQKEILIANGSETFIAVDEADCGQPKEHEASKPEKKDIGKETAKKQEKGMIV